MNLLAWLGLVARPDSVTADTRAWLDHESRGEQAARAELLAEHVRHGATKADLRTFHRKYGAASAVIGALRDTNARLRTERDSWRASHEDQAAELRSWRLLAQVNEEHGVAVLNAGQVARVDAILRGDDPADTVRVGDILGQVWVDRQSVPKCMTGNERGRLFCTRSGAHRGQHVATGMGTVIDVWPNDADADAAVVATAERLGNEIQPDQTTAIESAAITLRAHVFSPVHRDTACSCGWDALQGNHSHTPPQGEAREAAHARHVAEQLAAVGALGNPQPTVESSPPVLIDADNDVWVPRPDGSYYCPTEDISRDSRAGVEASFGPVTEKATES